MALQLPGLLANLETLTGRFVLQPFSMADVVQLSAVLAHDEIWSQGYGDGEHRPTDPADLAGFIQRRYDGHAIYSVFTAGPPGYQAFVGTTGLTEIQADVERVKIGRTVLDPRVWGSRANHEVKIALMDWLFSCGAGRIECDVDPRNQRSLRSLTRFGFTIEGIRRRSSPRADGSWRDIVVLSLLVEEWPQARAQAVAALRKYATERMAA